MQHLRAPENEPCDARSVLLQRYSNRTQRRPTRERRYRSAGTLLHVRNNDGRQRDTWASYVRAAREVARLSQAAVAEKMGVNRNTVGRWELGRFAPDRPKDVVAFARAVGVDPEEALA